MLHIHPPQPVRVAPTPQAGPVLGHPPDRPAWSWSSKTTAGPSPERDYHSPSRSYPSPRSARLPQLVHHAGSAGAASPGDMNRQAATGPALPNQQYGSLGLSNTRVGSFNSQVDAFHPLGHGNVAAAQHAINHHTQHGQYGQQQQQHLNHHIVQSRPSSRPESPVFHLDEQQQNAPSRRGSQQGGIVSYLQIPATISSSKGSLAEFAAQITCLFWFETSTTLTNIELADHSPVPATRLVQEATPALGFLKWVTTILSTTQVTQNVILLALLFIYRLKKQNPSVKGKSGSEYRLLTVALMLANKFLDDNTYTNLTWAEVSGISVQEIHVMEVEFLSHMKYNLYTSKETWYDWHRSLSRFWAYFDRASRRLADVYTVNRPVAAAAAAATAAAAQLPYTPPSPPASTNHSPPFNSAMSPAGAAPYVPNPSIMPPHLSLPTVSPTFSQSDSDLRYTGRKRSLDDGSAEPPAKRVYTYRTDPLAAAAAVAATASAAAAGSRRSSYASMQPAASSTPQSTLPALTPMSQPLHHTHTPTFTRSTTLTPISAERPSHMQSLPPFSWPATIPSVSMRPGTPTSAHGSYALPVTQLPQFASSASHTTTQNSLSPSHFLHQRSSPYRPVRNMSTLLVPPPSNQATQSTNPVAYDQMHWQPIGKSQNERHTGRVPYLHHEAWPATHQVENWPPLYPMQGYN